MNVFCENNRGFGWNESEDTFVKGYLYDEKNTLFQDENLINYFNQANTPDIFEALLKKANGFFIVIKKNQNGWLAAVDSIRSMPMFFSHQESQIFISDDAFLLEKQFGNQTINPLQRSAFLRSGHTLGNATLSDAVQQLEAGQYLYFDGNQSHIKTYYNHLRGNYLFKKKEQQFEELKQVSENIFTRLINYAAGKQIVIPLSGGYDSRYIAAMMKESKYENVLCYTYGVPSSHEVKIAKQVAQQLNHKWHYVEYPKDWEPYYEDKNYQIYASQLCSLPHEQDYIAIKELKEQHLIDDDAIIVPGFCGDLLGGSVIPDFYSSGKKLTTDFLIDFVYQNQFLYENKISKQHRNQIENFIQENEIHEIRNIDDFSDCYESFFTKNFVSKYVVNELRVFDYFGYEWSMPLWDKELIEWWYQVPNADRVGGRKRYDQFLMEFLFKKYNIDIPKVKMKRPNYRVKKLLGEKIMTLGRIAYINSPFYHDINGIQKLIKLFQTDLKKYNRDSLITTKPNKIMAGWYVYLLEESFLRK